MARFQLTKLEERIVPSSCWFGGYSGRGGSGKGSSGKGGSCRGSSGRHQGKGNNGFGNDGRDGTPNGKQDCTR